MGEPIERIRRKRRPSARHGDRHTTDPGVKCEADAGAASACRGSQRERHVGRAIERVTKADGLLLASAVQCESDRAGGPIWINDADRPECSSAAGNPRRAGRTGRTRVAGRTTTALTSRRALDADAPGGASSAGTSRRAGGPGCPRGACRAVSTRIACGALSGRSWACGTLHADRPGKSCAACRAGCAADTQHASGADNSRGACAALTSRRAGVAGDTVPARCSRSVDVPSC